jgi:hypothetical protein
MKIIMPGAITSHGAAVEPCMPEGFTRQQVESAIASADEFADTLELD